MWLEDPVKVLVAGGATVIAGFAVVYVGLTVLAELFPY